MKKILVIVMVALIVFMFIGCKQNDTTSANNNTSLSQGTPSPPNNSLSQKSDNNTNYQWKSDKYYLDKYIGALDICLTNKYDLLFINSKDIKNETLIIFFSYIVDHEKLYDYNQWFNKKEQIYHIPASIVQSTIKEYFNLNSFDISQMEGYDKNKNEIVAAIFGGFGGMNFPKILNKEYLGNNIIRLTGGFYDEKYKILLYKKVFTIEENPSNEKEYKYLSIVKIVNVNGTEVIKSSPD